jgi:hypothetical protein
VTEPDKTTPQDLTRTRRTTKASVTVYDIPMTGKTGVDLLRHATGSIGGPDTPVQFVIQSDDGKWARIRYYPPAGSKDPIIEGWVSPQDIR